MSAIYFSRKTSDEILKTLDVMSLCNTASASTLKSSSVECLSQKQMTAGFCQEKKY